MNLFTFSSDMIKLAAKITLIFLLVAVSYAFLLFFPEDEDYLGASIDKRRALEAASSPKIVTVGGSAAAFGVNSRMIEKATGYSAVNMGLHAGIPFGYMLYDISKHINPGDLVVLYPEYQHFYLDADTVSSELISVMRLNASSLAYLDTFEKWVGFVRTLPLYMQGRFKYLIYSGLTPEDRVYRRASFDKRGDMSVSLPKQMERDVTKLPFGVEADQAGQGRGFLSQIEAFSEYSSEKGACVYVLYPAITEMHFSNNDEGIAGIHEMISESSVEVLGQPGDFVLPPDMFFDTVYHLNDRGRTLNTQMLINELSALKGCS